MIIGDSDAIIGALDAELNRSGSRASVIQWFIDGRYATRGSSLSASRLINEYAQPAEIDETFIKTMDFIAELGKSGKSLNNNLKSINRRLMNNYKV